MIEVRQVMSKADFKAFFTFPWVLYRDNPHWVPELVSARRATLDKTHHPAWEYMTGEYFVAWRGAEPVGTIAAFVNHRHNQTHNENIGFFGFFECINDPQAAAGLIGTAEAYLRGQGVEAMRGPANFTSNEPYGLLVDSFDKDPMILMPYNPAYYVDLLEGCGLQKVMDLYSWRSDFAGAARNYYAADGKTEDRKIRAIRRSMERSQITVRTIDTRNKARDFALLRQLYTQAWEKNWGFVPLTDRELDDLVKNLGFLLLPEYTYFAYVKDDPAAFMLLIPNFNEVLKYAYPRPGVPEVWTLLKAAWHWKVRPKIRSLRVILLGVREEYRGIGVDAALNMTLAETMMRDTRFEWAEGSWVLETNEATNRLLEHFGAQMHRRHRIYQKAL